MSKYIITILEIIFFSIVYILDKLISCIVNIIIWYYDIVPKEIKIDLYELYGIDQKYRSSKMDKFLENYKSVTVKIIFDKINANNFEWINMESFNTLAHLKNNIEKNSITIEQLYVLLQNTILELEKVRNRPIISYYGYTTNYKSTELFQITNNNLALEDVDRIYELINIPKFSESDSVDLILNSLGGNTNSAIKIISLLRTNFKTVNIIVPNIAFSAATLISSSADEITVLTKTNFGLVNPYISGIDMILLKESNMFSRIMAYVLNKEYRANFGLFPYKNAKKEIEHISSNLRKYLNKHNIKNKNWLKKRFIIRKLVKNLCTYKKFQCHSMPISPDILIELGMNIRYAQGKEKILIEQIDTIHQYIFQYNNEEISKIISNSEIANKIRSYKTLN